MSHPDFQSNEDFNLWFIGQINEKYPGFFTRFEYSHDGKHEYVRAYIDDPRGQRYCRYLCTKWGEITAYYHADHHHFYMPGDGDIADALEDAIDWFRKIGADKVVLLIWHKEDRLIDATSREVGDVFDPAGNVINSLKLWVGPGPDQFEKLAPGHRVEVLSFSGVLDCEFNS